MTLRKKAIFIVGTVTLALIVILSSVGYFALLNGFIVTEENYSRQNVLQAQAAISNELLNLSLTATNLSRWDDTYAFIEDGNQKYIQANLGNESFINQRISLAVFVQPSGNIVYSRAFDLSTDSESLPPQDLSAQLNRTNPLVTINNPEGSLTGILNLTSGPLLVSAHPILKGDGKGPIRGTLILGRNIDSSLIERLSWQTQLPIELKLPSDSVVVPAYSQLVPLSAQSNPILVIPKDNKTVAGYSLFNDIYGKPALVLRIETPRDIYQQGITTLIYFSIIVALVGIESFMSVFWLLDRQILGRLSQIINSVRQIGSNFSARIVVDGKDELANLAVSVNSMLSNLQQTQSKVLESEVKYRTLIGNIKLGIFRCVPGPTGKFLEINHAMEEITGYQREDLMQMNISDLFAHEDERESMRLAIEQDTWARTSEIYFRKQDGTEIAVSMNRTAIRNSEDEILYFDGILEDITQRKQVEQEIQRLYRIEKTARLALEKEIEKRTEFTHALVHELRTPLTPIMASSELLLHQLQQGPNARLARNVYEGALNLDRRVEELLDLARGDIDMLKIRILPINTLEVIWKIYYLSLPLAANAKLTLDVDLPSSLPEINADEDRVRQILMNLINNAIKFTPPGGKVILRASPNNNGIVVEIIDNGTGISEVDLQLLFQPYQRLERGKEKLGGLGLGLVLAKRLVEAHNGRIWVKSHKGIGSTFGFFLPVDPLTPSKQEAPE